MTYSEWPRKQGPVLFLPGGTNMYVTNELMNYSVRSTEYGVPKIIIFLIFQIFQISEILNPQGPLFESRTKTKSIPALHECRGPGLSPA